MKKHLKIIISIIIILIVLAAIALLSVFVSKKFFYIALSILVLAFIIFFHELGHFTMGKLLGFRILDFSIGFGPALLKFKKGETTYAVRAIPFGGACQFDGEDEEAEAAKQAGKDPSAEAEKYGDTSENAAEQTKAEAIPEAIPETIPEAIPEIIPETPEIHKGKRFNAQPVWKRFLVILAGPFMNILLAFLVAFVVHLVTPEPVFAVDPATGDYIPKIKQVMEGSLAEKAGIKAGDTVRKVNGQSTLKKDDETSLDALIRLIGGAGNNMTLTVERGGETLDIDVTGAYDPKTNTSKIGITITNLAESERYINVWEATKGAAEYLVFIVKATGEGIGNMFKHGIHQGDISGVVGAVAVMVDVAKTNVSDLAVIAVILSLSLGLFNLIPFPALDGGRLLFLIIEGIRRKPLNRTAEGIINAFGLFLLFGLMLVVTVFDVIGLFK